MATRVGVKAARIVVTACVAAVPLMPLPALSLGLGELEMQSFLNEPLRAEVALLDLRELTADDIRIRLAGVDDFERLGVDRSYFLTSIQFEVDIDPASGRGVIRLSTSDAVLEPYLDVIVEARWPAGRVLREYTILVDPPAFRQDMITVSASERIEDPAPDKPALADGDRDAMEPSSSRGNTREGTVVTSGDRVAVRESSLPPGAMPERAFSAETSATPAAGSRYLVKRDETLWQIASRGRPEDVSVQQAMLDIQRINPEAFIDGNINRIKAGYIIYLPASGEVSSTNLEEALAEVRAQNEAFETRSATPGVTAAATLRVSAEPRTVVSDEVQGVAAIDPAPMTERVSMNDEATAGIGLEEESLTPDTAEDSVAAPENSAMVEQLTAMSDRLDTLEQIVSLKDEQIATLEQALQEAREEAAAAAAAAAARPIAPPPSGPVPTSTPSSGSSFPWIPGAGGLLVLVLGVLFFLRRRSASGNVETTAPMPERPASEDVFAGVSLNKDALGAADPEIPAASAEELELPDDETATEASQDSGRGGSRGYGEAKHDDYIDDAQGGDALAEADIYIAYGRYLQAVELLNTAIEAEPSKSAYRLKLIELYVDMGEEANATEQLEALRAHGDAAAIDRAEALLGAAPAATAVEKASLGDASGQTAGLSSATGAGPGGFDLQAPNPSSGDAASGDAAAEEGAAPAKESELDLDSELTLDLDIAELGENADDSAADSSLLAGDAPVLDGATPDAIADESHEFDELEIESEPGVTVAPEVSVKEPDDILDLTDALADFEDANIDGGETTDAENNEFMVADDADQMATKLDLARAYLDMGDGEGARGILEEVASGGNGEQQEEARELLSRIG